MITQPQLKLNDPRYRRPMMTIDAAKGALDRCEDEVVQAIDDGRLVAWNIASAGAERRELRIWTRSVSALLKFGDDADPQRWPWSEVITAVVPTGNGVWLTGLDIQRALNCGSTHVLNLVTSGALAVMPGTRWQRGPGGSPAITRASFMAFLESRLENALCVTGLIKGGAR